MTTSGLSAPASRRILLADADAFYVSVARLMDPEGVGREPFLIVGGSADGRGVVTSASYETRAYGVRSAMPTAAALRLCPQAVVVPVPRHACVEKSKEILEVLRGFSPVVEPASIDEFYLDMTGTERLYANEPLALTAGRIRAKVLARTGLAVSVGGGTSRLIAKMAAKLAKPRRGGEERAESGVHVVPPGEEARFMAGRDLAEIPMIGPRFQERLARHGLRAVRDVLPHERDTLVAWFGHRTGRWLYDRVRGRDTARVTRGYERKSIGHEETFVTDLESDEALQRELLGLAVRLAADMRRKHLSARTVTVKIRDADFTTRQASHTLPMPIHTDRAVIVESRRLLRRLRRDRRTAARLLGISLSQLRPADAPSDQLALFADPDAPATEQDEALSRAVDDISSKYGARGIVRGSQITHR